MAEKCHPYFPNTNLAYAVTCYYFILSEFASFSRQEKSRSDQGSQNTSWTRKKSPKWTSFDFNKEKEKTEYNMEQHNETRFVSDQLLLRYCPKWGCLQNIPEATVCTVSTDTLGTKLFASIHLCRIAKLTEGKSDLLTYVDLQLESGRQHLRAYCGLPYVLWSYCFSYFDQKAPCVVTSYGIIFEKGLMFTLLSWHHLFSYSRSELELMK